MAIDPTAAPPQNYASYPSLVDRTVFVTGGADGIGAGIVEQFVRQGSRVALVDINEGKAAETVERCQSRQPRYEPIFYPVDLLDIDALQNAVTDAQATMGSVTVLVNNAANDERHTWQDMTPEYWGEQNVVQILKSRRDRFCTTLRSWGEQNVVQNPKRSVGCILVVHASRRPWLPRSIDFLTGSLRELRRWCG